MQMKRWYEPRKNRPDIPKDAKKKTGVVGYLEILWREFFSLVGLNMLFVVCCLPIITIPAAITGMSYVTVTMVRDKNHFLFADFFRAFKRDFWRSLLAGIIFFVMIVIFAFSAYFYYTMGQNTVNSALILVVLAAVSGCMAVLTLMTACVFFPMLSMVELNVKALIKNSLVLIGSNFKKSVALFLTVLFLAGFLGIGLLPQSTFYIALIMFSLVSLITSYLFVPVIEKRVLGIEPQKEEVEEEEVPAEYGEFPELESGDLGEFPDFPELEEDAKEEE